MMEMLLSRQRKLRLFFIFLIVFTTISLVLVYMPITAWFFNSNSKPVANVTQKVADATKQQESAKIISVIPKILHQVFSSEMVYSNYKSLIASCLENNPDWKYYLWRDSDAEALISDRLPEFSARYKQYRPDRLHRSDSIRYILLYFIGGIYLDMDVECVKPFFPTLANETAFLDREREEQTQILWHREYFAMNSAMGSRPGHPFFLEVTRALKRTNPAENALTSTGPIILTRVYEDWISRKSNESTVHLLPSRIMSPELGHLRNHFLSTCGSFENIDEKPLSELSWRQRGCLTLKSKNGRADDSDNTTVAKHKFLNLGYPEYSSNRGSLFNMTQEFGSRVNYYLKERAAMNPDGTTQN